MGLADNIAARETVEKLGEHSPEFWTRLAELAAAKGKPPAQAEPEPMTYEQAVKFEKAPIPYGAYEGEPVGDLPKSYLCRVLDPSPFNRDLRRYVRSRRFQEREE